MFKIARVLLVPVILAVLLLLIFDASQNANGAVLKKETVSVTKKNLHLSYVEFVEIKRKTRAYVEMNDGSKHLLKSCKFEDSEHCFWLADKRGNGVGKSFIRLKKKTFNI